MKRTMRAALSLILVLLLINPAGICAYAGEDTKEKSAADEMSIIDEKALETMVEELLMSYGVEGQRMAGVSFAYTYLATGDTWYYNPDIWHYSASMYKVPMMMVLAEREAKGELSADSDLGGITLAEAEELILVWSNNNYAHLVRRYLGGDENARKLYQAYSPLEETYYHSDFIDYCYFTARYMNDVMVTLYNGQENFPNIIDCLKQAMPENFYHKNIDPSIEIAQKYGSYLEFNNNTGIIFTPNPFALTIMSDCLSYAKAESLMADAAKLFMDYTLALDEKLASYEKEVAEAEARAEEEARLKAEEEERLAKEEAEKKAAEEKARLEEEKRLEEEAAAEARREALLKKLGLAGAAVVALIILGLIISNHRAKKLRERELMYRREQARRRRYGSEGQESRESSGSARRRDSEYRPRH